MKYTKESIEKIAKQLRELPAVEKEQQELSKADAVKLLAKDILLLQSRGYTMAQISESLTGNGLDISTPTLKNYLHRGKPIAKKVAKPVSKLIQEADTPAAAPPDKKAPGSKATFTPRKDSKNI
jgi:hypothetical protein